MRDFYSIYVMSYCEGFLHAENRNLTGCSHPSLLFSFNATEALTKDAGNTTSLSSLGWPSSITDDLRTFGATSQSMGVFYCIGIGLAGLAVLERLWFVIAKGPRQTVVEVSSLMVGSIERSRSRPVLRRPTAQFHYAQHTVYHRNGRCLTICEPHQSSRRGVWCDSEIWTSIFRNDVGSRRVVAGRKHCQFTDGIGGPQPIGRPV